VVVLPSFGMCFFVFGLLSVLFDGEIHRRGEIKLTLVLPSLNRNNLGRYTGEEINLVSGRFTGEEM